MKDIFNRLFDHKGFLQKKPSKHPEHHRTPKHRFPHYSLYFRCVAWRLKKLMSFREALMESFRIPIDFAPLMRLWSIVGPPGGDGRNTEFNISTCACFAAG